MRENKFINDEGQVVLKKATAPPGVDEKLGEEEGTIREKNDALILCRKYIGQMMWLTTRTRPDIAACLGILASLMVRRPKEVKNHLVCWWRYLWTTKDHAMCTLPSPKATQKIQKDECAEPQIFAENRRFSQETAGNCRLGSVTLGASPLARSYLMPAVVIHESCRDTGLEVGQSPQVLFVVKTDSQVTLTQLRNESVTTRSRPFANKFSYAHDMCHGASTHPASVKAIFVSGKSQKADGLTNRLDPSHRSRGSRFDYVEPCLRRWCPLNDMWNSHGQRWIKRYHTLSVA